MRVLLASTALLAAAPAAARDCAARLTPPAATPAAPRAIAPGDLVTLRDFGVAHDVPWSEPEFSIAPDGQDIAVLLRRADPVTNRYCHGLALVRTDGSGLRILATGGETAFALADTRGFAAHNGGVMMTEAPSWSPDGQWIAWLRRDQGVTRLWRVRRDGIGAEIVTREPLDVQRFAWDLDGALIYEVRPALVDAQHAIEQEGRSGYLYDRRFWPLSEDKPYAPAATPYEIRAVAPGEAWRLASPAQRERLGAGLISRLTSASMKSAVADDGAVARMRAVDPRLFLGAERLEAQIGGKTYRCETPACARGVLGLWWTKAGELIFLRDWKTERHGTIELFSWRPGAAPVSRFTTNASLFGCTLHRGELVCARETATQPRQIVAIAPASGAVRVLLDPNPQVSAWRFGAVERLTATAGDGAPVFGDLVLPPGHRPGQRHPLVIVQYTARGFLRGGTGDEYPVHALAARGYAVLSYQRPEAPQQAAGAQSRNARQRSNVMGWRYRRRALSGLEALVDRAIAGGAIDPAAIGITGLSDGADTVNWALIHTRRYKAAVVSGCCMDPSTANFSLGLAFRHDARAWGYPPPGTEDEAFWAPASIRRNIERIEAPLLIQTADRQYRMALDSLTALVDAGKPVEMYVFPDEYHVKWQPAHRLAIYTRVIDWFDFWIRNREDPDPAKAAQYARWRAMREAGSASRTPGAPAAQPGLDRNKPR
ncbi:MAG TPA: Atxe2 family lasso peptide isopeptidase [Sphingomonas sp.]|nr:Atxe2 family lasso peptide isopeptidase [Sphingomonas sp.]